jgi:hypothetical protein
MKKSVRIERIYFKPLLLDAINNRFTAALKSVYCLLKTIKVPKTRRNAITDLKRIPSSLI